MSQDQSLAADHHQARDPRKAVLGGCVHRNQAGLHRMRLFDSQIEFGSIVRNEWETRGAHVKGRVNATKEGMLRAAWARRSHTRSKLSYELTRSRCGNERGRRKVISSAGTFF